MLKVFLTGATGCLGGELLVRLSQRPEVERVLCLVRGESTERVQQRLRNVFQLHGQSFPEHRLLAVPGNLLDEDLAGRLARCRELETTQLVVHAAANTSFLSQNDAIVRETNIVGLGRLLQWAERLPDLRSFVHVSTASICGRDLTQRNVMEGDSPDPSASQLVSYTASKLNAEMLVRERLPADRVLIARPSIILGDSRGWAPRSDPVLWAMAAINQLRLVPVDAHAPLDIVPVDFAADAILRLIFSRRRHDVYHVSSGPRCATSAGELALALSQSFGLLPPFRFVPSEMSGELAKRIRRRVAGPSRLGEMDQYLDYWARAWGDARRVRAVLAALRPYFRFMELGQTFDNERLLRDTGMKPPPPAHLYMQLCMAHLARIDVLRGAMDP
jgi:long-chain acyl-CoA synthetase